MMAKRGRDVPWRGNITHQEKNGDAKESRARGHLFRAWPSSQRLYAVTGPHDGPYFRFLRLSALASGIRGDSFAWRCVLCLPMGRSALLPGNSADDGPLLSRRPLSAGGVRSISIV